MSAGTVVVIGRQCADAVFIGRPFLFAAAFAGQSGVAHAIKLLTREIDRDMAMPGIRENDDIGERFCATPTPCDGATHT
jgi:isopentenyl diphosphate isomerase/L-lactate dehydrogenase-like FMN-dependent dehydrogenase